MVFSILAAAAGVFAALTVHPFVTYPLSLRMFRARSVKPTASAVPSFALCLCAYNEEAVIGQKILNCLALRRAVGQLDILVYVDAATDRTAEIVSRYADQVRVVISPERRGKTSGMNLLVLMAEADILVFTDANVEIAEHALTALGRRFADPAVGCVCSHLVYRNDQGTPTSQVGSLYWRIEEAIKEGESRLGAAMGADGSLFAIRRSLHRPTPPELIDDMHLSLSILLDGHKVVRADDALAFEASVTHTGEEFRRKVRIACQAFNVHRRLWPRLRKLPPLLLYMYLSHKFLRWLCIYDLSLAVCFSILALGVAGIPAFALVLLPAFGVLIAWIATRRRIPVLSQVAEMLSAFLATGIGVAQSFRGRTFQTWTSAASIRVNRP